MSFLNQLRSQAQALFDFQRTLPATEATGALMDELARLLVGEPSRFA